MKSQSEIEKEFDKRFMPPTIKDEWENLRSGLEPLSGITGNLNTIKSFIRQLRQDDIKSLIEILEGLKIDGRDWLSAHQGLVWSQNQKIQEAINQLKNKE